MRRPDVRRSRSAPAIPLVGILLVSAIAACGDGPSGPGDGGPPPLITELPRSLQASEAALVEASNGFGFAMGRELAPEPTDNLFFSPLSASMALGMTLNGADGETFTQMRATLGYGALDQAEINASYASILELLEGLDPAVTLAVGNSVWSRQGAPILPDFLARVEDAFDAEVAEVDFGAPATLTRINDWVDERTDGQIDKILSELPGNTVMLLLNAVHFDGRWREPFDPDQTRDGPFTTGAGGTVTVPLMERDAEDIRYYDGEGFRMADLGYGGDAFAMTIVVPEGDGTPEELLADLDADTWATWIAGLQPGRTLVTLPRFELEWESDLNDALKALGMLDAFDPGAADFSRLIDGGGVWVDRVFQKSAVSVDEAGTTASAATGVILTDSAPPSVRADRPFLFALRERLTGTILFMGIVNDPSA